VRTLVGTISMVQARQDTVTFDEFIDWLPESTSTHYELHRGAVVEMPKPRGKHSDIAGHLIIELGVAIRQAKLPYFIPKECIVRSVDGQSGYEPDVIVLERQSIANEPKWEKESVITQGQSMPLIIEVVSTNWQDDYGYKLIDYEALGIREYWIVDYLGLGGRRYIGSPKQPTLSIYQWLDGEYEVQRFHGDDSIYSTVFPMLNLTAEQIFTAGAASV
jgi:Uma2 family endonuclease